MSNNRSSLPIPQTVMDDVMKKLVEIQDALPPYLNPLSEAERHGLHKMGPKSVDFVSKTKDYTLTNQEFVPFYMDVPALKVDVDNVNKVNPALKVAMQVATNLSDMVLLSGHEALDAALDYYNAVKLAAHNQVPNAKEIYNDLAQRFPGRTKKKPITPAN